MNTQSALPRAPQQAPRRGLALHGEEPVRAGPILPYARQLVEAEDVAAVVEVLRSPWLTTGPKVAEFEEAVAAYVGAAYAVAFSSGTAALHGAVSAAGVGEGDEGITTPLTFCATANCLLFQGAQPVFADVEEATLMIDPQAIQSRITRKTKVILPVDYGGHPARLDAIRALSRRHGLLVIEDACHALGAEYGGRRIGSLSDITVFSFHPVKHITTGEGGMAVTNDAALAARLRRFRNHGIVRRAKDRTSRPWYYEMVELGYNYRISDIACALGRSQLSRLAQNLARRRAIAQRYTERFSALPGLRVPEVLPEARPAWHLYPVRIASRLGRDRVFRALREEQIGVNVHYIPVTRHPYYRKRFGYRRGAHPVAERAARQLISLPMFHGMSDRDVERVIQSVEKVLG
ncbi:MAG: UDP-4-amino-4,6-dideoxy-N-acetyl-beta-L-altrosamine transaminase [Omnitrophica WOR_2 bacterium RIFCSPLOWO2_12_FULL_63_16]|nr:MAG: UDP-4-amino-4,6-dideoxy-N-acetyl-beta-L-altrosamine transaminase [Omnitrophica WOR_2 bacterium RIFCSPLOWO2_12_FULL_63_16]